MQITRLDGVEEIKQCQLYLSLVHIFLSECTQCFCGISPTCFIFQIFFSYSRMYFMLQYNAQICRIIGRCVFLTIFFCSSAFDSTSQDHYTIIFFSIVLLFIHCIYSAEYICAIAMACFQLMTIKNLLDADHVFFTVQHHSLPGILRKCTGIAMPPRNIM